MTRRNFILDLDIETNGFNGPVTLPNGETVLGCQHHAIMELACRLIDPETLEGLGETHLYILDEERINNWDESTKEFHSESHVDGTAPFIETWEAQDKVDLATVQSRVIEMLEDVIGQKLEDAHPRADVQIFLAARSQAFDRSFLNAQLPELGRLISHQALDVSAFRVAFKLWHPTLKELYEADVSHNALDDVDQCHGELESIATLVSALPTEKKYIDDFLEEEVVLSWLEIALAIKEKIASYFIR